MPAQDAAEVVIGANGQVYVAPTDAPGPTESQDALDGEFRELGFVSEDGATVNDSKDVNDVGAWQSFYPIRRNVTGRNFNVAFALRQWNDATIPLAFGGGVVATNGAGEYMYTPPEPEELDERQVVIDWQDGDKHYRLHIPRGTVSENVETNLTRTAASDLPITFSALKLDDATPIYTLYTDDPAFAAGS